MNVIVCVDSTRASKDAVSEAAQLISDSVDSLLLVHSLKDDFEETSEGVIVGSKEFEEGQEIIDDAKQSIPDDFPATVESKILSGDNPVEEVSEFSESENADMIVIGHRDLEKKYQDMFGSFTQKMLERSNVPILVV